MRNYESSSHLNKRRRKSFSEKQILLSLNHMAENIFSKYEIRFFLSRALTSVCLSKTKFFPFLNNIEQNLVKQEKETQTLKNPFPKVL